MGRGVCKAAWGPQKICCQANQGQTLGHSDAKKMWRKTSHDSWLYSSLRLGFAHASQIKSSEYIRNVIKGETKPHMRKSGGFCQWNCMQACSRLPWKTPITVDFQMVPCWLSTHFYDHHMFITVTLSVMAVQFFYLGLDRFLRKSLFENWICMALVLDVYAGHFHFDLLNVLHQYRIVVIALPSLSLNCLQPLDVCVFSPFKSMPQAKLLKLSRHMGVFRCLRCFWLHFTSFFNASWNYSNMCQVLSREAFGYGLLVGLCRADGKIVPSCRSANDCGTIDLFIPQVYAQVALPTRGWRERYCAH